MSPSIEELQHYLRTASMVMGEDPELSGGTPAETRKARQGWYSLAWYFSRLLQRDLDPDSLSYSPLLAAFLSGNEKDLVKPVMPTALELREEDRLLDDCFPQSAYPLNPSQRRAVHAALHNPLTVVIGPPGTGKTETILRILALAVARGESVAMVSSNHSAVDTVIEKVRAKHVEGTVPSDDLMARLDRRLVCLGKAKLRYEAADENGVRYGFSTVAKDGEALLHGNLSLGWEQHIRLDDFCKRDMARCITSTIHSLKKCFADGDVAKYDLVVMDEASQSSVLLGIVAMSSARRIVVVGDDEQLPPVVPESLGKRLRKALGDDGGLVGRMKGTPYDLSSDKLSFLGSCRMVFGEQVQVMLDEHYRCHPAIIGFCNEYVYKGNLKVCTEVPDGAPAFPIGVRWYEGSYRERDVRRERLKGSRAAAGGDEGRWRPSAVNCRQLTILLDEEMEHIRMLHDQGKSICFASPFWGQVQEIERIVKCELGIDDSEIGHEIDGYDASAGNQKLAVLTIHRSQGSEYDCVYLLPVEDGNWEWPWSQGKRLVNVAVSRAKSELHLIVSTKLMSENAQEKLLGRVLPVSHPADEGKPEAEGELYVRKLIDYVMSHQDDCAGGPAWCGMHRAKCRSVFDWMCWLQADLPDNDEGGAKHPKTLSAAEALILSGLSHMNELDLAIARNVWCSALQWRGTTLAKHAEGLFDNPSMVHFDFVVFERSTRMVVAVVEVDGNQHRYDVYVDPKLKDRERARALAKASRGAGGIQERDWAKEELVRSLGGVCAWLGEPGGHQLSKLLVDGGRRLLVPGDYDSGAGEGNRLHGWACAPDQLTGDCPFVFLRIPTDGSTCGEFDWLALGDDLKRACSLTVDAFIRAQRERMRLCTDGLTVSEKVAKVSIDVTGRNSRAGRTLSRLLSNWGASGRLDAVAINQELKRMGILRRDQETGSMVPTELGEFLGISSARKVRNGKAYYLTTYDHTAQRIMRSLLGGVIARKSEQASSS